MIATAIKPEVQWIDGRLKPKLSVVGMGKLGQPFAVCLAASGFEVLGIDKDEEVIDSLFCGKATVQEPGLQELLHDKRTSITFSTNLKYAITDTDVTFILVGTPSNADGSFSNCYIVEVLEQLCLAQRQSDKD